MMPGWLRRRQFTQGAAIFLIVGLFALGSIALWSFTETTRTAASVRQMNAVSDNWGKVSQSVSIEYEALVDFRKADDELGRAPLLSAIGSARPMLDWLKQHDNQPALANLNATYKTYTTTLWQLVQAQHVNDPDAVDLWAQQAEMASSSLRRQVSATVALERLSVDAYLTKVEQRNGKARVAASIIGGTDLALALLCTFVLLAYQRGIERQADESKHLAAHDNLTGIPNRARLNQRVEQALRSAAASGGSVGLLLLDLNKFKEVNDTLGHHQGDLLLQTVANRLSEAARASDTVARLGGDEFAVLLPEVTSPDNLAAVAERMLEHLQRPAELDGVTVDVRASVGGSVYPDFSADADELLQHADIAMYEAKRCRLGTKVYNPATDGQTAEGLGLLAEFLAALNSDQLLLHYQPKVFAATGAIAGVEALVRWQHPRRGLLQPAEFLEAVDESELVLPTTTHILRLAAAQAQRWGEAGLDLPLAVNISARCLVDPKLPDTISALLAEYGVRPSRLTLEFTERALTGDPVEAAARLGRLRACGVRISIDDFGTGSSSLSYLGTLPLDEVKIDRSFIAEIAGERAQAIVQAIARLGHAYHWDIVAEGVEDKATYTAAAAAGCTVLQGFAIHDPVPAEDLAAWVASGARARETGVHVQIG